MVSVKQLRHAKIRQLLQGAPIDTHEKLADALRGESIVPVPLEEGLGGSQTVDLSLYRLTQELY